MARAGPGPRASSHLFTIHRASTSGPSEPSGSFAGSGKRKVESSTCRRPRGDRAPRVESFPSPSPARHLPRERPEEPVHVAAAGRPPRAAPRHRRVHRRRRRHPVEEEHLVEPRPERRPHHGSSRESRSVPPPEGGGRASPAAGASVGQFPRQVRSRGSGVVGQGRVEEVRAFPGPPPPPPAPGRPCLEPRTLLPRRLRVS